MLGGSLVSLMILPTSLDKRSQVLAFGGNIDVDHAEELVVIDLGWRVDHLDVGHVFQHGRIGVVGSVQRNLLEVLHGHRANLLIGVLHGEEVVVAVVRIDPVTGSDHAVGGERGDHVVYHIAGSQPQPRRHLTSHVELQAGIIQVLRNQHIAHVVHGSQLPGHFAGHGISGMLIVAADLDVDGRRHALIDHRIHQAAGLRK